MYANDWWNKYGYSLRQKSVKEEDERISRDRLLQRMDAATGNERWPTVARRYAGTCSRCDEDECRRWRPGGSATRTSWFRYGVDRPFIARNASNNTTVYRAYCMEAQRGLILTGLKGRRTSRISSSVSPLSGICGSLEMSGNLAKVRGKVGEFV